MAQAPSITFSDVLELLKGSAVNGFESQYAARQGCVISPNWGDSQRLTKELAFTGVSRVDLEHILESRTDELSSFIDAMQTLPDHGEEWPEGEEPEDHEPNAINPGNTVVYARGFSILVAATVWLLERKAESEVLRWLKFRRIPHHKKHAADLRGIFKQCIAQK